MKLELKHLSPYLPYDLKGFCTDDLQGIEIMNGLKKISDNCIEVITDKEPMDLIFFKPILFPLSQFVKFTFPREVEEYLLYYSADFILNQTNRLAYFIIQEFLSNKIDVFGLIEAGLAEPVTEDFNPYK